MTTVQKILDKEGNEIYFVSPRDIVLDALKVMENKDVGAVLVKDGDRLVGMFAEHQYARKVFLKGRSSPKTLVHEAMEADVICVAPEQTAEACMSLMAEKRIRHLPVVREEHLVGMISIGDVAKNIIADREFTIERLEHFIRGR